MLHTFSHALRAREFLNCIRASRRVCQINLLYLVFWKNNKNMPPTVWHMIWQNLTTWQTEVLHAHICTLASVAQMHVRSSLSVRPAQGLFLPSHLLLKECVGVVVWHVCCLAAANPLQGRGARRARLGQGHHQEFSAPPAASMLASYRLVRVRV